MIRSFAIVVCLVVALLPFHALADGSTMAERHDTGVAHGPEQMVRAADDALLELREGVTIVSGGLVAAERADEAGLMQCIASRLVAMRALLAVAQDAADAMTLHLEAAATELARYELRKVLIARTKSAQLRLEAAGCGQSGQGQARTTVEVTGTAALEVDETEEPEQEREWEPPPRTSQFE